LQEQTGKIKIAHHHKCQRVAEENDISKWCCKFKLTTRNNKGCQQASTKEQHEEEICCAPSK
jgi:hypothetical protein